MADNFKLFFNILKNFQKAGVLNELVLIGSWCQYFYRIYFNGAPEIPAVRTVDLDFLILNRHAIKKEVNIPEILGEHNFVSSHDYHTGFTKYVHPDLEVEFLAPLLGSGIQQYYDINKFHVKAVGLRFLNISINHLINVEHEGITIRLPEPAIFVINKLTTSQRRKKVTKKQKDLQTAIDIGEYLITIDYQKERLTMAFNELSTKWKKSTLNALKHESEDLYNFFKSES
jgi:hypothetical protein